ncbi:DUF2007 domain-containing protein [Tenacibaculum pacificus]|uniref:DUF2007 domain-containing protein n=1 Tax=Tenacibaculum pacificus TaxID=3018314 RepID=UPI0022F3FD62|nr:DUF2007 domain-containing protein [Tenacibaculum pacificus]WBX73900.1 DUF2007 domain-containing protein [Tenacibaculum pacificus]
MQDNYSILTVFENSTEAHLLKSKLDSNSIRTSLMDEKTIDTDPWMSQAIGGVKLLVHNDDLKKALHIYNEIRVYEKDENSNPVYCKECNSSRILVAPPQRKNFFLCYFLFLKAEN